MSETTIEWTATIQPDGTSKPGYSFNPWWGCTHVHEGCRHCYAETWAKRFGVKWGPSGVRRVASEAQWKEPLKWDRAAQKSGVRAKVFCASMADVFEEYPGQMLTTDGRPAVKCHVHGKVSHYQGCNLRGGNDAVFLDDARRRLFSLIDSTPHLDWQLLTKRPQNIRRMWPTEDDGEGGMLASAIFGNFQPGKLVRRRSNVWIGTSISDQASADKQIPELLRCRDLSPVLFVSAEPLLGAIDLRSLNHVPGELLDCTTGEWRREGATASYETDHSRKLEWVIVGSESGASRRAMRTEWATSIIQQCQSAGVACFMKQMDVGGKVSTESGMFPEEMRVREFPATR